LAVSRPEDFISRVHGARVSRTKTVTATGAPLTFPFDLYVQEAEAMQMLQQSRESLWEFVRREPKTQQRRCTESCSHDTFVLEKGIYPVLGGRQDLRSQHLLSSLVL
ncbi:unnamed protein product, partial [Pleuronectes platessa]